MKKDEKKVTTTRVGQILLESLGGIILILLFIPIILATWALFTEVSPVLQEVFTIILCAFVGLETFWSSIYLYSLYRARIPPKAAKELSGERDRS
jgi:hypothetical protein